MKVFVSNNYGGEVCKMEFLREDEECYGFGVKIDGFIETDSVKIHHLTSRAKFVQDSIEFKVPRNIIPSFKSKNFIVEYIVECTMIYKDWKDPLKFPLVIFNNNIGNFDYQHPLFLDLNMEDDTEYQKTKVEACKMLLGLMDMSNSPLNIAPKRAVDLVKKQDSASFIERKDEYVPLDMSPQSLTEGSGERDETLKLLGVSLDTGNNKTITKNADDEIMQGISDDARFSSKLQNEVGTVINRAIHKIDEKSCAIRKLEGDFGDALDKVFEEVRKLENETLQIAENMQQKMKKPDFREPNVLESQAKDQEYAIYNGDAQIGIAISPSIIFRHGWVIVKYLKEAKNTYLQIWREDSADGKLIDAECICSVGFDSENCLEKRFEFIIDGFTLKTFAFTIEFVLILKIDGLETRIPLQVVSPSTLIVSNTQICYST